MKVFITYDVLAAGLPKQTGEWLRCWTSDSINRTTPKHRREMLAAAKSLAKISGQRFPAVAYRVLEIDIAKVSSWDKLAKMLRSEYPESFSTDLSGVKAFLRDAAGGHHKVDVSGFMVFAVQMPATWWMFNVRELMKQLPLAEQHIEDRAGFSLREYSNQREVVGRPGILRAALTTGQASLVGYEKPRGQTVWLPKPKRINAIKESK